MGGKALAEVVSQFEGFPGNGTGGRISEPCGVRVDWQLRGGSGQALLDRPRRGLRTGGSGKWHKIQRTRDAFSGATGNGRERRRFAPNDLSRNRQPLYADSCLLR